MRQLTKAQKSLIENFFKRTKEGILSPEVEDKVAALNDYETVYVEAQRYLDDLVWCYNNHHKKDHNF